MLRFLQKAGYGTREEILSWDEPTRQAYYYGELQDRGFSVDWSTGIANKMR